MAGFDAGVPLTFGDPRIERGLGGRRLCHGLMSRSQDARRPLSSEHRSSRLGGSNFHNLQSLKVSIPGPLRTRSRANERLIIGMVLARKRGLRSDATGEHLTRDRCYAVHLTHLPQHLVVQQPVIRYVVWRARRD